MDPEVQARLDKIEAKLDEVQDGLILIIILVVVICIRGCS